MTFSTAAETQMSSFSLNPNPFERHQPRSGPRWPRIYQRPGIYGSQLSGCCPSPPRLKGTLNRRIKVSSTWKGQLTAFEREKKDEKFD